MVTPNLFQPHHLLLVFTANKVWIFTSAFSLVIRHTKIIFSSSYKALHLLFVFIHTHQCHTFIKNKYVCNKCLHRHICIDIHYKNALMLFILCLSVMYIHRKKENPTSQYTLVFQNLRFLALF